MKIGILTFHRAENFGAVLQCYALQTFLKNSNYEVKIIDYRCKAIENAYYLLNPRILFRHQNFIKSIRQYINRLSFFKDKWRKKQKYKTFRLRMLETTRPYFKLKKDLKFDAYIVGSDQVWNNQLTGGYDQAYYLDFPTSTNVKRIAYAVSNEENALPNMCIYKKQITKSLRKFHAISVREEFFANALKAYTPLPIDICCDPTFLLSKDSYMSIASMPQEDNFIFVYHVKESKSASELADNLSKQTGCKIIELHAGFAKRIDTNRHLQNLGPTEILGYMLKARYIITTSFHGLALSLILEKQFYVVAQESNIRQRSLLKQLQLDSRIVSDCLLGCITNIDYENVNKQIDKMAGFSKEFIIKNL